MMYQKNGENINFTAIWFAIRIDPNEKTLRNESVSVDDLNHTLQHIRNIMTGYFVCESAKNGD